MSIDWTRKLRTTGPGHHAVRVVGIEPDQALPIHIVVGDEPGDRFVVTRDGRMAEGAPPYVENVPGPVRILERWTLLWVDDTGAHRLMANLSTDRPDRRPDFVLGRNERIARILIEEPT